MARSEVFISSLLDRARRTGVSLPDHASVGPRRAALAKVVWGAYMRALRCRVGLNSFGNGLFFVRGLVPAFGDERGLCVPRVSSQPRFAGLQNSFGAGRITHCRRKTSLPSAQPGLRATEQRNSEITAQYEFPPAILDPHRAAIGRAGLRIQDLAAAPSFSVLAQAAHDVPADDRLALTVIRTLLAGSLPFRRIDRADDAAEQHAIL